MMWTLLRKLLRDVRLPLVVVALLLCAYQCLWVKVTERITGQLVPFFVSLAQLAQFPAFRLEMALFQGPGKIVRSLMGGENIALDRAMDMMSIGYVHPVVQILFCIWAIGRAAGAIAGEIDRGSMELLMAQPVPRYRLLIAHGLVDLLTIPLLCLSLWAGTWLGTILVGPIQIHPLDTQLPLARGAIDPERLKIEVAAFGPALWNAGTLLFAVSGYTMWLSAQGRSRWRVLGLATFITLLQFLINLIGQLWEALAFLRPLTIFYYYQPQQIILNRVWTVNLDVWNGGQPLAHIPVLAVLGAVGALGYLMALWTFCRRDLPAPL